MVSTRVPTSRFKEREKKFHFLTLVDLRKFSDNLVEPAD
jgi:hypothetical protein